MPDCSGLSPTETVKRASRITSQVARHGRQWFDLVRPISYLAAMSREVLASQLIWNCLTAKESKCANERKVRGIGWGARPVQRAPEDAGPRAYIQVPLPLRTPGGIAEIFVVPNASADAEGKVTPP